MNGIDSIQNSSRIILPIAPEQEKKVKISTFGYISQICTCLIPDWALRIFAGVEGNPAQAWREKFTLCLIIFGNCFVLAFLTYGINKFICKGDDSIYIYSKLNEDTFNGNPTIVCDGGIFYTDDDDDDYGFENQTHLIRKNSSACKRAFGGQLVSGDLRTNDFTRISDIYYTARDIARLGYIVIGNNVYDPSYCDEDYFEEFIQKYRGAEGDVEELDPTCWQCFHDTFYCGKTAKKTNGCVFADILLWASTIVIFALIFIRFFLAMLHSWYSRMKPVSIRGTTPVILQVTCYSESESGLRLTLDSLTNLDYNENYKIIIIIADGNIKGAGETETTPEIIKKICKLDGDCTQYDYISLVSGHKRHNRAEVQTGYYEAGGKKSNVLFISKVGNPIEVGDPCNCPLGQEIKKKMEKKNGKMNTKPLLTYSCEECNGKGRVNGTGKEGNRGKRDSQVIIMSFFEKLLYHERLSPLDIAMHRKLRRLFPHFKPSDFELLLMVDADTLVEPDALKHMVSAFEKDQKIMGLCGETQIVNKTESLTTMIQVFEYYISHHLAKNFESVFGGVTCLPGCFCIYRIKLVTDQNGVIKNHSDRKKSPGEVWETLPILANPLIVNPYSAHEATTLHEKNLLHLGEDRYLTTLLMKSFYKRKLIFVPGAKCKTCVPADYKTLRSQRRRWINSTIHNMFELVIVNKLCGTFCCSMQFIIGLELFGTLTLPAAIIFTFVLVGSAFLGQPAWIPLIMLGGILGLPAILITLTTFELQYWGWLIIYILALPIWNFFLPVYAFWKFDDFSWGDTRKTEGSKNQKEEDKMGTFDSASISFTHLSQDEY